jgi:L,D-peptidoglycan transpeptidase YkuD (ErfK/YbiS/YcfS/YnhG family)
VAIPGTLAHVRAWQIASTAGAVAAVGLCTAAVVAFASAQPRDVHATLAPLPPPSGPHVSALAGPAAPSTHATSPRPAPHRHTTMSRAAPKRAPTPTTHHPARRTTTTSKPPPPPPGQALPLGYGTGTATRVITVVAPSTGSTTAVLSAWSKAPGGGWLRYGSAVTAHVGSQGLTTQPSESKSATPIGSFTLTQGFGALPNPGTALPYFQTDAADWWISQSGPLYNTHQHCSSDCSFTQGDPNEHLRYETPFYNYAVVIDYNRFPVTQGAGSAFFLHVTDGNATAGCVAIPQANLVTLMRWLTPAAHPRILIGVA